MKYFVTYHIIKPTSETSNIYFFETVNFNTFDEAYDFAKKYNGQVYYGKLIIDSQNTFEDIPKEFDEIFIKRFNDILA